MLPTDYLDSIAPLRGDVGSFCVPWPMPGKPDSFPSFDSFAEWRAFLLQFSLNSGIPHIVSAKFERAQTLYLLAWLDFDRIKAGELVGLTALELALNDRYGGKELLRRRQFVTEKAKQEARSVRKGEKWWVENATFADLLKHMVEHDGLTDTQVPMNHRCGSPSSVIWLLTGTTKPSLADIRNDLAHGIPFRELPWAGLLELMRDLIDYAYR